MPSSAPKRDRLFCLEESVWDDATGLSDQTSVLPTLELLQRMGMLSEFVHRHCVGNPELNAYLERRLSDRRMRSYGTLYLAFHGTGRGLDVTGGNLSLDVLAERIGTLQDGVLHLGSCSVLRGNRDAAQRFLRSTGARLVTGYERDVDWLDSAALDTAWLGYVAGYAKVGDALRHFRRRYASTIDHLKWEVVQRP